MKKHTNLYEEIERPDHRAREQKLWEFDRWMFRIAMVLSFLGIFALIAEHFIKQAF